MNIDLLKAELTNDPLTRGYAGMTAEQAAVSLNTANRSREHPTLSASQIFESIDIGEYAALAPADRASIDRVLNLGDRIIISTGSKARSILLSNFGGGTATRAALIAVATESITRATELGLGGAVLPGHVEEARRI